MVRQALAGLRLFGRKHGLLCPDWMGDALEAAGARRYLLAGDAQPRRGDLQVDVGVGSAALGRASELEEGARQGRTVPRRTRGRKVKRQRLV